MATFDPHDLLHLVSTVSTSVVAVAMLVGLGLSLLRWFEGVAPRLAAIGFGLMLISIASYQVMFRIAELLFSGDDTFYFLAVAMSLAGLLNLVGWTLLIAALQRAFNAAARRRLEVDADR